MTDSNRSDPSNGRSQSAPAARAVAFLLGVLLTFTLPLSLLAFDVARVVFNPDFMKTLLTEEVVHSDLIPIGLEWFSERRAQERVDRGEALTGVDEPDIVLLLSFMDRGAWRDIKTELLTDEFLTNLVSVSVDGVYTWIDSADRVPQITWDLRPFIEQASGDHGERSIEIAYDRLPDCTEEQIQDFTARLSNAPPNTEVLYNLCEFPDPWFEDQFSDYLNSLFKVVENAPPQFALTDELAQVGDQDGVGPEALKSQLRQIRLIARWAWLLPMTLALLIAALVVRSLPTLGRWEGSPFLFGGLLGLVLALVLRPAVTSFLAAGPLSEIPPLVAEEALRISGKIFDAIFSPLLIQSGVFVLLGLVLLLFARRGSKTVSASN
jgi:hypothetical protein